MRFRVARVVSSCASAVRRRRSYDVRASSSRSAVRDWLSLTATNPFPCEVPMLRTTTTCRVRRRFVWAALSLTACLFLAPEARAATARVRWMPRGSVPISRYDVYVRDAGTSYAPSPVWSGFPTPAADGALEALVTFTAA